MKKTLLHLHHHLSSHIKQHHKKYLFGIFWGYAVVKLFALVLWLSVVQYSYNSTFAQLASGCTLTGQYYTGAYETWWYMTGQILTGQVLTWWELTGGELTWCITLPWYWTWGTLDELGVLTGETRIDETQTGCILTWQTLINQTLTWGEFTGWYMTGYYLTWWYRTWGYITWCEQTQLSWVNQQQQNSSLSWNGICESGDIVWNTPLSWSVVRNIFPIRWSYSWVDCLSWLSLQLRDHNSQWITLKTLVAWSTWYDFDSASLYSFQQSWLYHIIWTGTSGQYYLYTGIATWTYSRLFSWYMVRLITSNQTGITQTAPFIISNDTPTITWITLLSSWSVTWYIPLSGSVVLSFIANQPLTGVQVTLWWGKIPTSSVVSWLSYTYTRILSSLYSEGPLAANIVFTNGVWTTGNVLYTWSLVFDKTLPVITWIVFSGYASWVYLDFSWSEPVNYTINYWKALSWFITGASASYLTAQQFIFSWIDRAQLYSFTLTIADRAWNFRVLTGDVLQTALWTILSHVYFVPIAVAAQEAALSWTLATLSVVLKAEVGKFNTCKNALSYTPIELTIRNNVFTLQMPMFKKSQVKTLVNAFTLFVLDKIKKDSTISSSDITEITKKFDNFLIILKLLRDDDNTCKQNLSNYHISQFKKALEEYKLTIQ